MFPSARQMNWKISQIFPLHLDWKKNGKKTPRYYSGCRHHMGKNWRTPVTHYGTERFKEGPQLGSHYVERSEPLEQAMFFFRQIIRHQNDQFPDTVYGRLNLFQFYFAVERNVIVGTVFLTILNRIEFHSWFKIETKTVTIIIYHSIWKEMDIYISEYRGNEIFTKWSECFNLCFEVAWISQQFF